MQLANGRSHFVQCCKWLKLLLLVGVGHRLLFPKLSLWVMGGPWVFPILGEHPPQTAAFSPGAGLVLLGFNCLVRNKTRRKDGGEILCGHLKETLGLLQQGDRSLLLITGKNRAIPGGDGKRETHKTTIRIRNVF